ncbi:Retrovirus-related Pol polyprotein from type-2 retrotransposable element R2DM, partial [Frankliniella fusca]
QLPRPPPQRPHQPRLGADWVLTRLNDEEELQLQYRTSLDEALERAAQAAAPAPLSWGRLRDALVTAANATIRVPPSPLTPRTALALDLRDRAQHAARMAPADPQARNDLHEANAALAAQKRIHERDREARFFAQVVEALVEAGAPPLLTNRVISLALTDRTYIRWMGQATSTVTRGRGVRMGCPVSPWLFTLVLHRAVARAVQHLPRFDLAAARQAVVPAVCAYADDLLVVAADYMDVAAFLDAFVDRVREIGLVLNYRKCEYLVRSPGAPDPEPFPRPARVGQHQVQPVDRLVYLGAVITNQLSRQPGVHHRVRRMQLSATAILPTFRLHPLPGDVLDRMYNTILLPSIQYDQAVGSTTRRSRATLRREAAVTLAALHATARHPGDPRPLPPPSKAASVNRAIRAARVQFAGHIHRRPPGHPLRTALHLDLGRKK